MCECICVYVEICISNAYLPTSKIMLSQFKFLGVWFFHVPSLEAEGRATVSSVVLF